MKVLVGCSRAGQVLPMSVSPAALAGMVTVWKRMGLAVGVGALRETVGLVAPQVEEVNVANDGAETFPRESVATSINCQVPPAESATKLGWALLASTSCA